MPKKYRYLENGNIWWETEDGSSWGMYVKPENNGEITASYDEEVFQSIVSSETIHSSGSSTEGWHRFGGNNS